jgi:hypothetical protein
MDAESRAWLIAFAFTQAFEMPIYLWVMRRQSVELSTLARVLVAFGATALTHPIVWFVLPVLQTTPLKYWGYVAVAEAFAVLAEAFYVARFGIERALLWAFVANATSATLGLLSRWMFGIP